MRTFQVLVILAGTCAFLLGLRIFGRSYSSTRWPVTQGRVVRSHILPAGDDQSRVVIQYEFILAGRVYSGSGLERPSVSGVVDSLRGPLLTRSMAESLITAYPVGREIMVGFDPGDPRQSVLRPRLRWWSLVLAFGGSALMVGGIWGRRLVHRSCRFTLALAGLVAAFGPACRRAGDQDQSGTVPASNNAVVPEEYRFLSLPGVGVESLDSIWARLPYDSVYLRREPCFGACPMYEATLYRGGKARYTGTRFVERIGSFQGEVTIQDYGRLAYLMDRFAFMALPDSFSGPYTDLPGATMAASRRPGGLKAVHDYGYVGPVELWTLMEVFDGVLGRIQWEKAGP